MPVVLGYHGCDKRTAQLLLGGSPFEASDKPYDWLGYGAYFWQEDPKRAYQWALQRRGDAPCVIGAAIELGNCLDLTTQRGISLVSEAHRVFQELQTRTGQPMPENQDAKNTTPGDYVLRFLDRAVIDHLHSTLRRATATAPTGPEEFATVRALFPEGDPIYSRSGFRDKTHIQIAVRKMNQVLGVFRVPDWQRLELNIPDCY